VFLRDGVCGARHAMQLGGEATCQYAKLPIALSGSCSVASPAKRRLGALLSSEMIEWRVERDGSGHPVYGEEVVWVLAALVGRRVGRTGRDER
jgi:hypothetical protein